MTMHLLKLNRKYSRRIRALIQHRGWQILPRPRALRLIPGTVQWVEWLPDIDPFTQRLVRRLKTIGAVIDPADGAKEA